MEGKHSERRLDGVCPGTLGVRWTSASYPYVNFIEHIAQNRKQVLRVGGVAIRMNYPDQERSIWVRVKTLPVGAKLSRLAESLIGTPDKELSLALMHRYLGIKIPA
jgi:hypothetical protein